MKCNQLAGVELGVNLESPEFDGVEIDKYNFIRIMEPYQEGVPSLDDFGSGFEVRDDGIYLKLPADGVWVSLTEAEREVLAEHPLGKPDKPVLAFPFTTKELKVFLDWAESAGHDVPIVEDSLLKVIEAQTAWRAPIAERCAQSQKKGIRHKSIPQQRVEVIQQWFNSQCQFTRDNLRPPKSESGQPWARQACWTWLSEQGFTSEGLLFGNVKQSETAKTKTFIRAWSCFINQS